MALFAARNRGQSDHLSGETRAEVQERHRQELVQKRENSIRTVEAAIQAEKDATHEGVLAQQAIEVAAREEAEAVEAQRLSLIEIKQAEEAELLAQQEEEEALQADALAVREADEADRAEADAQLEEEQVEQALQTLLKEESEVETAEAELAYARSQLTPRSQLPDEVRVKKLTDKVAQERAEAIEARRKWEEEKAEAAKARATALAEKAEATAAKEKAAVEKAEAVRGRENASKERAEAEEAKETAAREKAEAVAARTAATEALASAAQKKKDAIETRQQALDAQREEDKKMWTVPRVQAALPMESDDLLYKIIMVPAMVWVEKEKAKLGATNTRKRQLDNIFKTMHSQCEHIHEDREFLLDCFDILCDGAEQLVPGHMTMGEDELEVWITVLNHGEKPTHTELVDVIDTLDNYKEECGGDATDGVLELEDFLLVTFDYYMTFGVMRMRALYSDLLLT